MDNEPPSVSSAVVALVFAPSAWREDLQRALSGKTGVRCIVVDPSAPLSPGMRPALVVADASLLRSLPAGWRIPDGKPRIAAVCRKPDPDAVERMLGDGADLVLPRVAPEQLSRMLAGEVRTPAASSPTRCVRIDLETKTAYADGKPLALSRNEFLLLRVLVDHAPKGLPRKKILEEMHGSMGNVQSDSLRFTVNALRKKLGPYWSCVRTVWGSGYAWNPVPLDGRGGTGRRMIALAVLVWVGGLVLLAAAKWSIRPCVSLAETGPAGDSNAVACAPEPAIPVRNRDVAAGGDAGTNAVPFRDSGPFHALRVFAPEEAGPPEVVRGTPTESEADF